MNENTARAVIERGGFCDCTNTQLERGETCGLAACPNVPGATAERPARHRRFDRDGMPVGAVLTAEGRPATVALALLRADPRFDPHRFAWVGSEHLGGGCIAASIYAGREAESPYLWITEGEADPAGFLLCLYVGGADGEEAEDPFLVSECGAEKLVTEALRMLASASPDDAPGAPPGVEVEVSDAVAAALIGRAGLRREDDAWVAPDHRRTSALPEALLWALALLAGEG